jgi:hypothetical protein
MGMKTTAMWLLFLGVKLARCVGGLDGIAREVEEL